MAEMGHEDQFLPPKLNARSVIRKQTVAATRDNGQDAPIPDIPAVPRNGAVQPKAATRRRRGIGHPWTLSRATREREGPVSARFGITV